MTDTTLGSLAAAGTERDQTRSAGLDVLKLASLGLQLGLIILVARTFTLESTAFQRLLFLATGGFLVHAILPLRYRQTWFILLSLAGIGVVFGIEGGLWLIGIGLLLIAIARLPISWWVRVGLLVLAAGGLAVMRAGILPAPFSLAVWPILASMFMFRLGVYMRRLRHTPARATLPRTLAYFFMLPNIAFPLFPVVDFKLFDTGYFNSDRWVIYQTGARWIVRGLFHRVLYRIVYYYLAAAPAELQNLGDLLKYVSATYLIYLRVSGQFHIIVGILRLFGWNLPEGNHLYFLSSGCTDFWRRINIYWKDFMMKLVYFPSFFRLRKRGNTPALIIATIVVFLVTWLLHSYQWFWVRGDFPLTPTDALFWGTLGTCMMIQMLRETRKPRQAAQAKVAWSLKRGVVTVGFFWAMSALWALWDSHSIAEYFSIWSVARHADTTSIVTAIGLVVVGVAIAGWPWGVAAIGGEGRAKAFWRRDDVQGAAVCAGLLLVAQPSITGLLGPRTGGFVQSLRENRLNERDAASMHRGYYEQINVGGGLAGAQLEEVNEERPADWVSLTQTKMYRELNNFLGADLVPSTEMVFKGEHFRTNSLGMRDREYTREKAAKTYRIVLLGPSDFMGAGVSDSQTFDELLENRLNRELSPRTGLKYEILNLSVVGYSLLQQMEMLSERGMGYDPDLVIAAFHPISEARFSFQRLANVARYGIPNPYPDLVAIVDSAGVDSGTVQADAFRRLKPYGRRLLEWSLTRMDSMTTARGIPIALVVRDMPAEHSALPDSTLDFARQLGYDIIDIRDVYAGQDPSTLLLASYDKHPNAKGHRLIAERLFTELVERRSILGGGTR
jgi:D-alanyl-lipoteichoic acid acyltransferase DltB (MBOAT superfamily)